MKRTSNLFNLGSALLISSLVFQPQISNAAAFTPGNLVALRVGDGSTALGSAAAAVSLAEYTTAAGQTSPVQTISADSTATGLTLTGTSATQGVLNRSTDGTLLTFGGYRKAAGGTNPQSDATTTTNRVIGFVGVSGATPNIATAVTDGYSADSFRSVFTENGSSFYLSGAGATATGGVRYVATPGAATTSVPINNGNTGNPNTRQILILGGNIYLSSGAANPGIGVHKVGTGLPTSGSQTYTGSITTAAQIQSFYFTNLGSGNNWASSGFDTVYTADGTNLSKFSFNGTTWALNNAVAITGIGNIIGTTSAGTVTLYGTDTTTTTGRIFSLTDTAGFNVNNNGSATTLATAGTNYAFRGISFAPVAASQPELAVSVAAPATGTTGVNFDYTLTASNNGSATATGVSVNFTLPSGLSFVSAAGTNGFTGVNNAGTVSFTSGTINAASNATLTVTVTTNVAASYTASIGSAVIDPANTILETDEANNTSTASASTVVSPPVPTGTVSITNASIVEGNSGTSTLNLSVTRGNTDTAFTVNYAVTGGTATSGTDYVAVTPAALTFTAGGSASGNISITVNGDTTIELNETIVVTLSGIVNTTGVTTLGTAVGTGTITNDDTVPVSFPASGSLTSTVKGNILLGGAEIPAFDPLSKRGFTSSNAGIQVVDLTNPASPVFVSTIAPATLGVSGLTSNDVSSISVRKGAGANPSVLAAAIISVPKTAAGYVVFLNAGTGALLGSTTVGANPDHIAFTPDGTKLLVANEGELDGTAATIPDSALGTVSIINVSAAGVPTSSTAADFTAFDAQTAALKAAGVRIFGAGVPSTDFEPEYFAISADSTKALVTLQEANAVAVLDIATSTFTSVTPLGKKNFATGRHDFSDRDGAGATTLINPTTGSPVYGLYMPDAVASYSASGQTYYVTANEGDDRNDFLNPDETTTVGNASYDLDNAVFPNEAALKNQASLGRLTVSNATGLRGDTDNDGDIDEILSYGGRSFSILDAAGNIVWDSGDMIENIVASQFAANFDDGRSDNKGPEPEGVTIATLGARTYAFIGLERSHLVLVFDVTNPAAVTFATGLVRNGDLNPEGLVFVSAADSPTGKALLLVASEVSNTLTIHELNQTTNYTLQVLHYYGESGLLGIQTAPIMGAMIDRFDDQYANTVVLGEGDSFIPGPWLVGGADPSLKPVLGLTGTDASVALGRPDIAIMNAFGTTASALGNHEFDLGSPVLSSAISSQNNAAVTGWVGAQFPLITANLNFAGDASLRGLADATLGGTGTNAFAGLETSSIKAKIAPYAIKTLNGQKIGFVGATTWDLLSKTSPNGTVPKDDANAATDDLQEVAAYVQGAINALNALGVNKIVMIDQLDTLQRNKDLAGLVTGIDVMVAGGGHERMGDATDTAVAFSGHDANFIGDAYPIVTAGADGAPTLIVTTDTEYSYLGRLVVDFDADGRLILPNLSPVVNGAYAASEATLQTAYGTSDSAATIISGSLIGSKVKTITDAINNVIITKDGTIYGYTNVYLEGDRVFGRTQEVNLGNLSADANAAAAKTALGLPATAPVFSLKNGGGIRASLGSVLADGTKVGPLANPLTGKPANAISQLDVENALRFDNKMMTCEMTPQGLLNILNFAAGLSSGPTQQSGGYPQVGNIRFSYDYAQTAARVRTVVLLNDNGDIVARVVDNGVVRTDAPALIRAVILNFTANGGDGYPIKANADNFRYLLTGGTLSGIIDESLDFTAAANVPANALGEQKIFADYVTAKHGSVVTAYNVADTPVALDTRIQQLSSRSDTVNAGTVFMPTFAFSASTATVKEGAGKVTLTINRTSDLAAASVNISTANGTATAGTDYTALVSVPVSFALNETSKTVDVNVAFRSGIQGSRTFTATLSGAETASPATTTVTITEADTFAASSGPSSSATPYVLPLNGNWQTKSILTVGDGPGGYQMAGIPDGLGAYDNGDGTLTLLMNHELGKTVGVTRAHGAIGSFVSEWVINKSTLAVVSGSDLMRQVYQWNTTTQASETTTSTIAFSRFCSADLPAVSAFYNAATGLGTQTRIFMNGEESTGGGSNGLGYVVGHVATGPDKGKSYILGKFNAATDGNTNGVTGWGGWENVVASPYPQDKTVVVAPSDGGTAGTPHSNSVVVYVGTKTNTGSEVDKAGLTNGVMKFVNVTGNPAEIVNTTTRATNITSGTAFTLSATAATTFSRPEDGSWDPTNPNHFYFVTTDQRDDVNDGLGAQVGRTRLWRLKFTSITTPELGGTIDLVLTGGSNVPSGNDANMWDNMTVTSDGKLMLQEDVGGAAHNGKVWFYDPTTGSLTKVLKHDVARFGDREGGVTTLATAPYSNDEETSGVIDVTSLFGGNALTGDRTYLMVDQAHYTTGISAANVEGGQLLLVRQTGSVTGPTTTTPPYVLSMNSDFQVNSILSVGEGPGGYQMAGIPDGLGAYDNGDGTLTLLMNHELGKTVGATRAHGAIGAFVSEWVINKSTLAVVSGSDLMRQVYDWNATTQASNTTTSTIAFSRFCSADLPAVSAFYNAATGKGTQTRIFMNGEESTGGGSNGLGYVVGHVATGPDKGKSYILGKFNAATDGNTNGVTGWGGWENVVASPYPQDKTVVVAPSDGGTAGTPHANSVVVYVGTKTNTGSEVDKAGLTNGVLKFVNVTGNPAEIVNTTTRATNITSGTAFTLSATAATTFSRPEDGSWDPTNPNHFYFVTTDRLDQVQDGIGAQIGRTRLWRLSFTNITTPEVGGTIDLVLTGGVGNDANMWDNMTVTNDGKLMLQEDVGGAPHNGKVWFYDPATGSLTKVLQHNPALFGDLTTPATLPYTNDEETSGVIDVSAIFGSNAAAGQRTYLMVDQAHYTTGISAANVEGGQLLLVRQTPKIAFSLAAATSTVTENAGNLVLAVNRFGDLQYGATVNVSTSNGTAIAGTDFTALSNLAVTFAPGETSKSLSISIANRNGAQADRTFTASLTGPAAPGVLGAPSTTTVTIIDTASVAFAAWLTSNGYTGALGGDSDGDGVPDMLEYFFNANPNDGNDRDNLPKLVINGNDLEFRFTYLSSAAFPGYLKCSEDLINWVNATPGVDYEVISEQVNGVETAVRFRIFSNPTPTATGPFTYLTPFTAEVDRGALNQLTITNHGMVGAGRMSGESLDSFGETQGAASGLSITGWNYNSGTGQFSGTFNVLPDRGYNNTVIVPNIYSNYATRIHAVPFTFTPYYGAGPVAQTQIVPTYSSTTKFTYLDGSTTKFTTGLNPTAVSTLFGQSVGTVPAFNLASGTTESLLSFDAEAIHVFADGSGFVSDEYGTYIARFNAAKQFTRIIQLPASAQPHKPVGTLNFEAAAAPLNGRRNNQGLEGLSVSPDNKRLFALLQSATVQDTSGSLQQTRFNTRLYVYDIEAANLENPVLIGEYVVQLPRYKTNGNGAAADATAAQSEIVAISNTQFLMLPRDGNGLGKSTADPIVTKTVDLVDFSSATNVRGIYDAEGNQISPAGNLRATITPAKSTVVINLLSTADLTKFGFNTNTASPNQFTVAEKIEAMSLVPDTSTVSTEDYFLFVANDNDFQSSDVKMLDATGNIVSYGDARSSVSGSPKITNDAVFTAWRITITPNNRKFFLLDVSTAP